MQVSFYWLRHRRSCWFSNSFRFPWGGLRPYWLWDKILRRLGWYLQFISWWRPYLFEFVLHWTEVLSRWIGLSILSFWRGLLPTSFWLFFNRLEKCCWFILGSGWVCFWCCWLVLPCWRPYTVDWISLELPSEEHLVEDYTDWPYIGFAVILRPS
jgi:hypothetical protein